MLRFRSLLIGALLLSAGPALAQAPAAPPPPAPMGLTSSSFADGAVIPDKYTQAVPAPVSTITPSPDFARLVTPSGTNATRFS